jgi:hypothetical protein
MSKIAHQTGALHQPEDDRADERESRDNSQQIDGLSDCHKRTPQVVSRFQSTDVSCFWQSAEAASQIAGV